MTVWPLTLCSLQPPITFTLQIITALLKPLSPSLGTAMEIRGREIEPGQWDAYRVDGRLPVEEDKWSITKRWKWAECGGGFKVWGWQVFKILLLLSTLFLSSCRVFVNVFFTCSSSNILGRLRFSNSFRIDKFSDTKFYNDFYALKKALILLIFILIWRPPSWKIFTRKPLTNWVQFHLNQFHLYSIYSQHQSHKDTFI